MTFSRQIWLQYIPAVLVTAGIVVASLVESPYVPQALSAKDKVLHGAMYALLSITWIVPLVHRFPLRIAPYVYVWIGVILFGIVMEVLQRFCTLTRSGELADVYADGIGAIVGLAFVALWQLTKK